MKDKIEKIQTTLRHYNSGLVAVSGGVDSSVLLALAVETAGFQVEAVTASSRAHPREEIDQAIQLCSKLEVVHHIVEMDELSNPLIRENGIDRCYHCKKSLYQEFDRLRIHQGLSVLLDGSNADDSNDYRPGTLAIRELNVLCPLMDAGLTKDEVRAIAEEHGLIMWDAPASACLFTRIPTGEPLDVVRLDRIDVGERILHQLGFRNVRVRDHHLVARIEIPEDQFPGILNSELREIVIGKLRQIGYHFITLDLSGYTKGSMNLMNSRGQAD